MITDEFCRSRIEAAIFEWVNGKNGERNRQLLRRRLFDGLTFEQLAEEFELSPKQARTIVHRCEDRIYSHIRG